MIPFADGEIQIGGGEYLDKMIFHVLMVRYDTFRQYMCCGESWKPMAYLFMDYFKSIEH